jgi:hypothetical protein
MVKFGKITSMGREKKALWDHLSPTMEYHHFHVGNLGSFAFYLYNAPILQFQKLKILVQWIKWWWITNGCNGTIYTRLAQIVKENNDAFMK